MNTANSSQQESRARHAAPSFTQIIRVINLVREEADISEIDAALKLDPVITFRLMSHINSAGMGFPRQVQSIKQAITIFGYHGLYRWLAMLLVTGDPHDGKSSIGRMAVIRGRFLETVGKTATDPKRGDELFVIGIFSLLDAILGEPLEKLLNELTISSAMRQALLSHDGPYGMFLLLAEAIEPGDSAKVSDFCSMLEIDYDTVIENHGLAAHWADKMLAG